MRHNIHKCTHNKADAKIRDLARECIEQCLTKGKIPDFRSGICLFECFENKIKKKRRTTKKKEDMV